ncbi:hypothetical protein [Deinococcus maricopensis]|uniref:Outer membrane protein beta-barrel domain-containing protein n=1 Tax=Deinococcus maricopensis (strain DSM 21211 / LMG 22137 / NRRL B-23946 / LB-34) TaxID=709986 RepID=E8U847_DEIML|nr:hypothetical protein [Deinococcus maricopensis]ADV67236.1 hypothetical protein Deima_1587 [Deinococcus maricopensis DSM 21211]
MKKALMMLALATGASVASAESYYGLYVLGGQYTVENGDSAVRYGIGLPLGYAGGDGIALALTGDVSYLARGGNLSDSGRWMYGAGLGAGVAFATSGGSSAGVGFVRPFALLNAEFNTQGSVRPFLELNGGPSVYFGAGSAVLPFTLGARLGINFH